MARLSQAETVLQGALDDLKRDWEITRLEWRDDAREHFEKDYLHEILRGGRGAVRAMMELTHLMKRVIRECS
jgi:hypothetical protein